MLLLKQVKWLRFLRVVLDILGVLSLVAAVEFWLAYDLIMLLLFFLSKVFLKGLAIFRLQLGPQRTLGLVLRMPGKKCGGLVLRILSWRLELGHIGISEMITSWVMLIHLLENKESLEIINRFFQLVHPNYFVSSRIVSSKLGLESFSKEFNEVRLFWGYVSIKLNGNVRGKTNNIELFLADIGSLV